MFEDAKLIGEGHWGAVYDLGDGTVAKVLRSDADPRAVQFEYEVAKIAYDLGVPTPKPIDLQIQNGCAVFIQQKINGVSLARYVLEKPWKLVWATREMAKILARIHTVQMIGLRPIKRAIASRIRRAPEITDAERDRCLELLEALPDGDRLCHYDFHTGNILVEDDRCYVIDWGGATLGHPMADLSHAYVLNKVDGTLEDVPPLNRALLSAARGFYIQLFLYFYARETGNSSRRGLLKGIKNWLKPISAARLASYGDFETKALLKLLRGS